MTDTSDREIGRRIAALRKQRGWSQSSWLHWWASDQSVLSRIEAGRAKHRRARARPPGEGLGGRTGDAAARRGRGRRVGRIQRGTCATRRICRAPPRRCRAHRPAPRNGASRSPAFTPDERLRPSPTFFRRPSRLERKAPGADFSEDVEDELGERPEELSFALAYHDFSDSAPMPRQPDASARPAAPSRPEAPALPPSVAAVIADYLGLRPSLGARRVAVERVVGLGRRARAAALGRQAVRFRRRPDRRLRELERAARPLRTPLAPRARHRYRHARARPRRSVRGCRGRRGDRRPPRRPRARLRQRHGSRRPR